MNEELKPCPFCGKTASFEEFEYSYSISCDNLKCGASIGACPGLGGLSRQKLIERWNARYNPIKEAEDTFYETAKNLCKVFKELKIF